MPTLHPHTQQMDNYCGPACAQMVLGFFAQDTGSTDLPEQDSFDGANRFYNEMFTEPGEIERWINSHCETKYRMTSAKGAAGLSVILSEIQNEAIPGFPIVLLTQNGAHWEVAVQTQDGDQDGWLVVDPDDPPTGAPAPIRPHKSDGSCCLMTRVKEPKFFRDLGSTLVPCIVGTSYAYQGHYIAIYPPSNPDRTPPVAERMV